MQLAPTSPIHTALGTMKVAFQTASPVFVRVDDQIPGSPRSYGSLAQADEAARSLTAGDAAAAGIFERDGKWFAQPLAMDYRVMGPNGEDLGWTTAPLDIEHLETYAHDFWPIARDQHLVRVVDGAATIEGPTLDLDT